MKTIINIHRTGSGHSRKEGGGSEADGSGPQLVRRRALELEPLAGAGMRERESVGVEAVAAFAREGGVGAGHAALDVERVADERVARRRPSCGPEPSASERPPPSGNARTRSDEY